MAQPVVAMVNQRLALDAMHWAHATVTGARVVAVTCSVSSRRRRWLQISFLRYFPKVLRPSNSLIIPTTEF